MYRLIQIMDNQHNNIETTSVSVDCVKQIYRDEQDVYIIFKDPDGEEIQLYVESYKTEHNAKLRLLQLLHAVGTCMNVHTKFLNGFINNGDEENAKQDY